MATKSKYWATSVISFLVVLVAYAKIESTGSPKSSTGAGSEQTCATSGCHDDNPVNSGLGQLDFKITPVIHKIPEDLMPNVDYEIEISMKQSNLERFGFQIVAIHEGKSCGKFELADSLRTQLQQGEGEFANREYVTYTYAGTIAENAGENKWKLKWKSPDYRNGEYLSFYVAAVAANKDLTDKGDYVYLKRINCNMPFICSENSHNSSIKRIELK